MNNFECPMGHKHIKQICDYCYYVKMVLLKKDLLPWWLIVSEEKSEQCYWISVCTFKPTEGCWSAKHVSVDSTCNKWVCHRSEWADGVCANQECKFHKCNEKKEVIDI